MYIIQNAMKNLARNKGRNVLMAAITFFIIAATVVTMTINNAAAKIIEDVKLEIGSKVDISQDLMKMYMSGQSGGDSRQLDIDDYIAYAESGYLKETIFNVEAPVWSGNFYAVGDAEKGTRTTTLQDGVEINFPTCMLLGNSSPDTLADFGGDRELVEGRMFSGMNECVIGEELAALNGAIVGDTILVESVFPPVKPFTLTIVGIFSDKTEPFGGSNGQIQDMSYINRRNEIMASYDTVIAAGYERGFDMKAEYYLKNPNDLARFENEVRAKGLPSSYDVSINQAAYDKVVGPLNGLQGVSVTFMTVILILGAIVLVLVSSLAVRERKYEVGILRAMGMEKGKVAIGLLSEAVIIAVFCLVIGLGTGNATAQPIANGLLTGQVAAAEKASANQPGSNTFLMMNGQTQVGNGANDYKPISDIQVTLGEDTIARIILIALALAALSSIVGIIRITKYEPLKILRERN